MFAQANSEHCRHKVFNADWSSTASVNGTSLFRDDPARHAQNPKGTLVAYSDNASVIGGARSARFFPLAGDARVRLPREPVHILMKVEPHNHPTAISPYRSAASPAPGGEIRDEGATGHGAKAQGRADQVFSVSNLRLPDAPRPWEQDYGKPGRIASALSIMLEGPDPAARPPMTGIRPAQHRPATSPVSDTAKPRAKCAATTSRSCSPAGVGNIRRSTSHKIEFPAGAHSSSLGAPGSRDSSASAAARPRHGHRHESRSSTSPRCGARRPAQCAPRAGSHRPVLGPWARTIRFCRSTTSAPAVCRTPCPSSWTAPRAAGVPSCARFPATTPGMSPMEIWCNGHPQEAGYVLAADRRKLGAFQVLCARERCPYAVVPKRGHRGKASRSDRQAFYRSAPPIDLRTCRCCSASRRSLTRATKRVETQAQELQDQGHRPVRGRLPCAGLPTVADKTFLVTIGDRSVTGLICRDQMVGPWQVPVADCAVTASGYQGYTGEAMAIGERTPLALINAPASGRMAVGEALTNIASARIRTLLDVKPLGQLDGGGESSPARTPRSTTP